MTKILVGVDLSAQSEVAIAHAVALARQLQAEVILALVTFVPEPPVFYERSLWPTYEAYTAKARQSLAVEHAQLASLVQRASGQGPQVSSVIADGRPDEVLPELAGQLGVDLVVVGTHGRTGLSRALIGSVAEHVVRASSTSVYVARGAAPTLGHRKVVVGTDFEEASAGALARAARLVAEGGALDLVSCFRMMPVAGVAEVGAGFDATALRAEVEADLTARGAKALATVNRPGIATRFHVVDQAPKWGVIDFAQSHAADLVVVGSHGRRGLRRWLLGSVAEATVRHAPCSVLIARGA